MKECTSLALTFTQALAAREYQKAHDMLAPSLKGRLTVEELGRSFETIVPRDWKTVGPLEVGGTMTTWPDKKGADRGWVYVSIGGETYCEGITVIVAVEGGALRIREIEFGRP